jgi:prevent-host-death family protein
MATIFKDEIFTATDLNRRTGQVLDEAKNHPVTITRNDEAFALLPRKDASRLIEAVSNARRMVDLVTAISIYRQAGANVPVGQPFDWLNSFDMEELQALRTEVYGVFRSAMDGEVPWDDFEAVLHEWHESAVVLRSETLDAAFSAAVECGSRESDGIQAYIEE